MRDAFISKHNPVEKRRKKLQRITSELSNIRTDLPSYIRSPSRTFSRLSICSNLVPPPVRRIDEDYGERPNSNLQQLIESLSLFLLKHRASNSRGNREKYIIIFLVLWKSSAPRRRLSFLQSVIHHYLLFLEPIPI